jgi:hypothetical protein
MSNESFIQHNAGGTSFVGRDAVALYRATVIAQGLEMYAKHKMRLTRSASPTDLLVMASALTGKVYKRGQYLTAAADVRIWCNAMRAALPIITSEQE